MATLEQDRAAMRGAVLEPIPILEQRLCFGRQGDDQCKACTLRVLPSDYTGGFPSLNVIVPDMRVHLLKRPDGTPYTELVCHGRRTASTVVPGPSVGGSDGGVGAHAYRVRQTTEQGNPLESPCHGLQSNQKAVAG